MRIAVKRVGATAALAIVAALAPAGIAMASVPAGGPSLTSTTPVAGSQLALTDTRGLRLLIDNYTGCMMNLTTNVVTGGTDHAPQQIQFFGKMVESPFTPRVSFDGWLTYTVVCAGRPIGTVTMTWQEPFGQIPTYAVWGTGNALVTYTANATADGYLSMHVVVDF